ncbi:MAG: TRAP transporter substrate-binding protein DctP [Candidatus Marinimicrobia bacterium]|nr:TRAP transporter substrate-binding protein DctP [Candidatus Neomarinimicrobiota bacterium]
MIIQTAKTRYLLTTTILALVVSSLLTAADKPVIVKMASLAPEGSPWHEVLQEIAQDWRELSGGKVRLKIYAGGVVGDESDMVRKLRIGQIQAAALTAEGLSYIDRGIYALSIPLLASNYQELDWIRDRMEPELKARFADQGFKVLAWADVGWVYWFTRHPVRTPDDLRPQRIFTWAGDAEAPKLWKGAGFLPVPLSAMDVLPALETGLIDAVDATPLTVASFQWFGTAKHMTNLPWAVLTGALIITQEVWMKIPDDLRPLLEDAVMKRTLRIKEEIRYMDNEAIEVMKAHGLKVIDITAAEKALWEELLSRFEITLRGTLVDTLMFDRALELKGELSRLKLEPAAPN